MNEELLDSCYQQCNTNQDFNDKIEIMMKSYKNKTEFHLQSFFCSSNYKKSTTKSLSLQILNSVLKTNNSVIVLEL